MCALKSPMSQVMSHTLGGGGGEVTNHPVAHYAVSS